MKELQAKREVSSWSERIYATLRAASRSIPFLEGTGGYGSGRRGKSSGGNCNDCESQQDSHENGEREPALEFRGPLRRVDEEVNRRIVSEGRIASAPARTRAYFLCDRSGIFGQRRDNVTFANHGFMLAVSSVFVRGRRQTIHNWHGTNLLGIRSRKIRRLARNSKQTRYRESKSPTLKYVQSG